MRLLLQYPVAIVFLTSWVLVDLLTPLVRWAARRWQMHDVPGGHKAHDEPIPTLGGIALYIGFVCSVLASLEMSPTLSALSVGGFLIVAAGVIDDLRGVSAVLKLAMIGLATLVLVRGGIFVGLGASLPLATLATFLWIGLVTSAFNGVDNADGSAAGLAAIASFTVFAIAWATWQHDLGITAAALVGCSLGFLRYNFPPASIFLGDSGSFFLGFALSAMLVVGNWGGTALKGVLIPLTVVGVPLFDFILILVTRGLDGKYERWSDPITMCALDHTAHRLAALGLSKRAVALALYLGGVLCGGLAVWMYTLPDRGAATVFGTLLTLAVGFGVFLRRVEHRPLAAPLPPLTQPTLDA